MGFIMLMGLLVFWFCNYYLVIYLDEGVEAIDVVFEGVDKHKSTSLAQLKASILVTKATNLVSTMLKDFKSWAAVWRLL